LAWARHSDFEGICSNNHARRRPVNAVPAQNLDELTAYAKANPGKLSYGHAGVGTIQHLTGELFKSLAGASDIVQVPYRGTGPAIADLVAGQIPIGIVGVTGQVLELHRTGQRILRF
jgi:tripartite-type tricarboxylate transporter receptor subunit TctC